jgi:hypothetical protein
MSHINGDFLIESEDYTNALDAISLAIVILHLPLAPS